MRPYGYVCRECATWAEDMTPHLPQTEPKQLAGEYDDNWLILDVGGHIIVNSRDRQDDDR